MLATIQAKLCMMAFNMFHMDGLRTVYICHCRVRHAAVLEYIWLLNSHPEVTFTWMHGDKDSYRLAFHLANRSSDFAQVNQQSLLAYQTAILWASAVASSVAVLRSAEQLPCTCLVWLCSALRLVPKLCSISGVQKIADAP